MSAPNPWQIITLRQRFKRFQNTGLSESMRILKKIRQMKLDNKMLITTQFPRTVIWVMHHTQNSDNADIKQLNRMCRFIVKEWRVQFGLAPKKVE